MQSRDSTNSQPPPQVIREPSRVAFANRRLQRRAQDPYLPCKPKPLSPLAFGTVCLRCAWVANEHDRAPKTAAGRSPAAFARRFGGGCGPHVRLQSVNPTQNPPSTPRRSYQRHGLTRLRAAVRTLGPRVLDKRTTLGKALASWKADLVRDLGGNPSTQQMALIELATRTKLLLDSVDAWLLVQPTLINRRRRSLIPAVQERQKLADGLVRTLGALGLERSKQEEPLDLSTYLATKCDQ